MPVQERSDSRAMRYLLTRFSAVLCVVRTALLAFGVATITPVNAVAAELAPKLLEGLVRYDIESGNYFRALVWMDDAFRQAQPVTYAEALHGFGLTEDSSAVIEQLYKAKTTLTPMDRYRLGRLEYETGQCKEALKNLKDLKNDIKPEERQEWAYYRASCSIRLGGNNYAAKALSEELGGLWVAYGYFNLAMSYLSGSTDIKKAIVALRVASEVNPGKSRIERELNDRINVAAGSIYLKDNNPETALEFFKKVHLDSKVASQALYLNGVAYHELDNFRTATQSWTKVQSYPTITSGASEALLAIPFAYERSGYVGQALDAYRSASDIFTGELATIRKLKEALKKYKVRRILIEQSEIAELEWFLKKDVAKNTPRATFYTYLMEDEEIYDTVELLREMSLLGGTMDFWTSQLNVFDVSLQRKHQDFQRKRGQLNADSVRNKVAAFDQRYAALMAQADALQVSKTHLDLDEMTQGLGDLNERMTHLSEITSQGTGRLSAQLDTSRALNQRMQAAKQRLSRMLGQLDDEATVLVVARLEELEQLQMFNFERAEQGLIHILENIAESKVDKKHNPLDGRYR